MMDLHTELDRLAGSPVPATESELNVDLARGRAALRRRRSVQAVGGSMFAAAAAVAALSLSGVLSAPVDDNVTAGGNRPAATAGAYGAELVSYQGRQPRGFTVDTVPRGWFVQSLSEVQLLIAPGRAKNPGPGVDPSQAPIYDPQDAGGKIAVFLQSKGEKAPQGATTTVEGAQVILRHNERGMNTDPNGAMHQEPVRPDGDYGASVYVKQAKGPWVVVQFWEGLGFTDQQMMRLAAGVHAHNPVQPYGG